MESGVKSMSSHRVSEDAAVGLQRLVQIINDALHVGVCVPYISW